MSGLLMGTCLSNFKFVALTFFKLLAFNAAKTWPCPLLNNFNGSHSDCSENMCAKFEVRSFDILEKLSTGVIDQSAVHRQTYIE